MALFTPCQIVSLSCLGGRGKNILWHFCQAVKYGLIVTPAIMRRLVGWCLPYFSCRPILSFGLLLSVSVLPFICPQKKAYIYKKNAKIVCYLVTNG
ncbi:hypothetical protein J4530_01365 [Neisseria subflava]|uniref:hypothetical protein n=1 Tax=Neisseria subflava TaxID=28449 RepID=UPI00202A1C5F|nr:hypothetical protein [Neisseria subflava]MCL9786911.1 hypothetical protein [Neisseria subflava]